MDAEASLIRKRKYLMYFYAVLMLVGVSWYLLWSSLYNAWTDIGNYSLSVICIAFGLVGTLLYAKKPEPEDVQDAE